MQPEVVASTVFVDPATILLSHPDATRNFFRQKCRTAAEIFFSYFAGPSLSLSPRGAG